VVVFGGPHADVALDPGRGAALGTVVGTHALACVVDVSDLGSAPARRAFMTAFTAALYVGRWIEGQADRAEGRRILGALPRLACGEGWVWAPGDGVLARVAFPRIRTLDSSQTPRREAQASTPRALAVVDLSALRAALAGMAGDAPEAPAAPAPAGGAKHPTWNISCSSVTPNSRRRGQSWPGWRLRLPKCGRVWTGPIGRMDGRL